MVPPTGDEYMDLSHAKIRVRVKILTAAGAELPSSSTVAPINNFLHALFSNVQIDLNQKCITPQGGLYNYRALIENLLNYGTEAKDTHLTTSLFYKDTAGKMDAVAENTGYVKRKAFADAGEFEMESHIHADLFSQNKYMINGVQMLIKFYKSKPEFALMAKSDDAEKYKIKITDAILIIRKVKIAPAVLLAHAATMMRYTVKYPITRCEVKSITIPTGISSTSLDNIFLGQLPQRIIVAFVSAAAFNGSYQLNPFNFQHFNHTYLTAATDSALHITPLKPNFKANLYMQAYNTLFTYTGISFSDSGNGISREDFPNGYNLTVFDLTADISAHDVHWNAQNTGSLRIEVQFGDSLPAPITAIVFAEFNNLIELDRHRQVILDYSA